jgi:hypothetical protein
LEVRFCGVDGFRPGDFNNRFVDVERGNGRGGGSGDCGPVARAARDFENVPAGEGVADRVFQMAQVVLPLRFVVNAFYSCARCA